MAWFTITTAPKILCVWIVLTSWLCVMHCIRLIAAKICRRLPPNMVIDIFHVKIVCSALVVLHVPTNIWWTMSIKGGWRRVGHADTERVAPFLRLVIPAICLFIILPTHSQWAVWRHISFNHSVESSRRRWLNLVLLVSTLASVNLSTTAVIVSS